MTYKLKPKKVSKKIVKLTINKSREEFVHFMHKTYPKDSQYPQRFAMSEAYDFLLGKYDQEENQKQEIMKQIRTKIEELY